MRSTLEAAPNRFVIAYRDVTVTSRTGLKTTIKAGSPVLADDEVARSSPGLFFDPLTYEFRFELQETSESGRPLRLHTERRQIENLPPPGPKATESWAKYWSARLNAGGSKVRNISCEQAGETAFILRGEIDRAPTEIVEVESTLSDGRVATSVRKSYR